MCGISAKASSSTVTNSSSKFPHLPNFKWTKEEEEELTIWMRIQSEQKSYLPLTDQEQNKLDSRTIFVGNIDVNTTAREIERHFDVCGPVKVRFVIDRSTGFQKNHCFVEIENALFVELAFDLNGTILNHRYITVRPKKSQKTQSENQPPLRHVAQATAYNNNTTSPYRKDNRRVLHNRQPLNQVTKFAPY
ncbi:hypothetical protein B9Z55_005257 [Caenorhabditis nigoni]|uniref:RRM domain-containing protein n=1 Tax=Caenorhabditis nigoni TaxID=1611254 RepID=A0A2G5V024_9PELO|nr:hypothetical protein B9Z55_005257 [Caenorhabditis nigoni]